METEKPSISQQFKSIVRALELFPDGADLNDIKKASGLSIEMRTLQRRLGKLRDQGIVQFSGKTRDARYHLERPLPYSTAPVAITNSAEIPLSLQGMDVRAIISKPTRARRPVGYNPGFLTSYRPNRDSYLSEDEKNRLADLGKTASLNRPAGTYAKEVLQRLLIDLSWNSSRLEGNTYSLLDTQRLISEGKLADHKTSAEAQMILNHKDAIEFIVEVNDEIDLNYYTLTNLHALLSNNLLPDPGASGRLRTFGVGITNSVFTPLAIPQLIDEMFRTILAKATEIEDPFEQAFFIMVQLPYLQPFDDVNKRVSRLAANISLNKSNLAPLAFIDVPDQLYIQGLLGIYELERIDLFRDVFLWAYERSALRYAAIRQSLGEPDPFRLQYREEIRALIANIISNSMTLPEASQAIRMTTQRLPLADQAKFTETVETELLSMHEGNYARYRVSPSEYTRWKTSWKTSSS